MSRKLKKLCDKEVDRWNDILCELKNNEPIVGIDSFPIELKVHVDKENLHSQIAAKYSGLKHLIEKLIDLMSEKDEYKNSVTCEKCGGEMFIKSYYSPQGLKRFYLCQKCGERL